MKNCYKIIALLIFVLALNSCQSASPEPILNGETIGTQYDEVFIARHIYENEKNFIEYLIYKPNDNKVLETKKIPVSDYIPESSHNSAYANDPIAYDHINNLIIYSNQPISAYDGSCLNADGTCLSRIYQLDPETEVSKVLYESEDPISHIIIDKDMVYLSEEGEDFQKIKTINLENGQENNIYEWDFEQRPTFGNLVLSEDKGKLYQAINPQDLDTSYSTIVLNVFDLENKTMESQTITDNIVSFDGTNISANGRYFAVYKGWLESSQLFIYDLETQKEIAVPFTGRVSNYNVYFDPEGQKLIYNVDSKILAYDIIEAISTELLPGIYATQPSSSGNYMLYYQENIASASIYNFVEKTAQNTNLLDFSPSEIKVINWFNGE